MRTRDRITPALLLALVALLLAVVALVLAIRADRPGPAPAESVGPATDSPMCLDDWRGFLPADELCWDADTGYTRYPGESSP